MNSHQPGMIVALVVVFALFCSVLVYLIRRTSNGHAPRARRKKRE